MHAQVGDWVDGTPPYRVRWVEDDHETLVFPGPEAHIEPVPVRP